MDADSEYYNIYSKEPAAKVTIYTSILYFVIVIYESVTVQGLAGLEKTDGVD